LSACGIDDKKSSTEHVESKIEVSKKIEKEVSNRVESVDTKEIVKEPVNIVKVQRSGQDVFLTCLACHGADASKKALGKSQSIKGWDSEKTANALYGYKNGTYGGELKGIMKGQVSALSDEDIRLVSEYISKL